MLLLNPHPQAFWGEAIRQGLWCPWRRFCVFNACVSLHRRTSQIATALLFCAPDRCGKRMCWQRAVITPLLGCLKCGQPAFYRFPVRMPQAAVFYFRMGRLCFCFVSHHTFRFPFFSSLLFSLTLVSISLPNLTLISPLFPPHWKQPMWTRWEFCKPETPSPPLSGSWPACRPSRTALKGGLGWEGGCWGGTFQLLLLIHLATPSHEATVIVLLIWFPAHKQPGFSLKFSRKVWGVSDCNNSAPSTRQIHLSFFLSFFSVTNKSVKQKLIKVWTMGGIVTAAGRSLWNSVCDGLYLITRGRRSSGRILLPGLSLLPWTLKKRQKTTNNRRFHFPPWTGWSLPKPALFPGGPGGWACWGPWQGSPDPGGQHP